MQVKKNRAEIIAGFHGLHPVIFGWVKNPESTERITEALHGSMRKIKLQRTDPLTGQATDQTLQVKIPPGIQTNGNSVCEGKVCPSLVKRAPNCAFCATGVGFYPIAPALPPGVAYRYSVAECRKQEGRREITYESCS